jgi:hypothetical protein
VSGTIRSAVLQALRSATPFDIPEQSLEECLTASPELLARPHRIAAPESMVKAALLGGPRITSDVMSAAAPVLGNIAEAVVEKMLADLGWQPVYDDDAGFSFGHGVDLLMLDPALERMVAIEVKSTIQPARWPRLARGGNEQLTPAWFNSPGNQGMGAWGLGDTDVFTMVAQVHFRRRLWRSCIAHDASVPVAVADAEQLADLAWLS